MLSPVEMKSLCVGGIDIHLHKPVERTTGPIALVYLLHGRLRSKDVVDRFARKLVLKGVEEEGRKRELWVVTFVCLSNEMYPMDVVGLMWVL
jgi:hypothetical protein